MSSQDALAAAHSSWNAGDLDGYLRLYDETIRLHGYSPEPMDKDAVRGFYAAIFAAFDSPARVSRGALGRRGVLDPLHDDRTPRRRVPWACRRPATTSRCPGSRSSTLRATAWSSASTQTDMLGLLVQLGAVPGARMS